MKECQSTDSLTGLASYWVEQLYMKQESRGEYIHDETHAVSPDGRLLNSLIGTGLYTLYHPTTSTVGLGHWIPYESIVLQPEMGSVYLRYLG